ncbi:MAG: aminoacyl-tRNA hydrolase [Armatimonadota bacterium]
MYCLVGLGNPGSEYAETRHNVGFHVIDLLAERNKVQVSRHRHRALFGRGEVAGQDCLLVKPQTFMNDSGDAVLRLILYYHIDPADVIVIHDELALDLGVIRIRRSGSDAGHKGLRSVIHYLRTQDVARVRLGIGKPREGGSAINYVLSNFAKSEAEKVEDMLFRAAQAVETCVKDGLEVAMNRYNS